MHKAVTSTIETNNINNISVVLGVTSNSIASAILYERIACLKGLDAEDVLFSIFQTSLYVIYIGCSV